MSTPYRGVFPHSTKVHVDGSRGIRVPMREVGLSGGEPPLRVYDTSGPEGHDPRTGLPKLVLGSVASHVVAHAPCDVLVVKRV